MTLDLTQLTPYRRSLVESAYTRAQRQAREDRELAAAYDRLVVEYGYPNALDEVAERFSAKWGARITASRVRVARWGK